MYIQLILIYNVGLPTGKINNILVLDIDVNKESKNENGGMDKINEYIKQFGDINTLETITPSGGRHYYFKYDSSIPDIQYIMKNHLYTRAGVGGYSIDIRSDGGYIVAPPSSINENYYKIVNNVDIILTS